MTILLTPFMSCSAKVPIYGFFTAAFFPDHGALVMIILYFTGIIMGILFALLLRGTPVPGRTGALRDGAAQLPAPGAEKRRPAPVGKGQGLPDPGLYGDFRGHHHHLVPPDLRSQAQCGGRFPDQPAGDAGRTDCAGVPAPGLWQLADFHCPDFRLLWPRRAWSRR